MKMTKTMRIQYAVGISPGPSQNNTPGFLQIYFPGLASVFFHFRNNFHELISILSMPTASQTEEGAVGMQNEQTPPSAQDETALAQNAQNNKPTETWTEYFSRLIILWTLIYNFFRLLVASFYVLCGLLCVATVAVMASGMFLVGGIIAWRIILYALDATVDDLMKYAFYFLL